MAKTNGKRNRQAGHGWELAVIKILHERGLYDPATVVSARSNSKRLDDAGIDLMHLDEATNGMMRDSIQCKTSTKSIAYPGLLDRIRKTGRPGGVIFHRQTSASEKGKQMERDRFAITYMERYLQLMACEKFVAWAKKQAQYREGDKGADMIWANLIRTELVELGL